MQDPTARRKKTTMPQIPQEALAKGGKFLKPSSMGYLPRDIGRRLSFKITGGHEESTQGEGDKARTLRSLPVSATDALTKSTQEGLFPLNKTNMGYFVQALGDNSDKWIGHTFEAVIINQNNPTTSAQVLSWSVISETIK